MSDPTETARRVLDLDKQATQGPWRWDPKRGTYEYNAQNVGGFVAGGAAVCHFGNSEQYYPEQGEPPNEADRALIAEYRTAAPDLARALLESQAALAAAEEGRLAALDIAKGAYEARDEARAALAAANSRADRAEATIEAALTACGPGDEAVFALAPLDDVIGGIVAMREKAEAERDALRSELRAANVRADKAETALVKHQTEPDQADPDGWIRRSALNKWAAAAQEYRADLARVTADLAAPAPDAEALRAQVEALPRYEGKLLDAVPMTRDPAGRWVSRAEVIAALSAAPAPTPADTKEDDRG